MNRCVYIIPQENNDSFLDKQVDDYNTHVDTVYRFFRNSLDNIDSWLDRVKYHDYVVITVNSNDFMIFCSEKINEFQKRLIKSLIECYQNVKIDFGMINENGHFLILSKIKKYEDLDNILKEYFQEYHDSKIKQKSNNFTKIS